MRTVSAAAVVGRRRAHRGAAASGAGGAGRAGRRGEGGAAGAERRRRAGRAARADGGRGRRGRRPEGPPRSPTAPRSVTATRRGEVTLGGRRVPVSRPRARTADGEREVELGDLRALRGARPARRDVMLERMLAGVSTRRYARDGRAGRRARSTRSPRSTSKSAVSREFVSRTREHLIELMSRPLEDLRLAVLMLDGIELKGRCCVVALGHRHRRRQAPARAVGRLDRERHRRDHAAGQPRRAAAWMSSRACWSSSTAPRRCARRSATCSASTPRSSAASATRSATCSTTCPSATAPASRRRLRAAWALDDHDRRARPAARARRRARPHPSRRRRVAARGHGGDADRHPARRPGQLKRTLASTNPCESMIETVRRTSRNVKRWQNGDMCLRWTAAGMLEAEQQFRKIIGYADLAKLAVAVERDVTPRRRDTTTPPRGRRARYRLTDHTRRPSPPKFHDERDILENRPQHDPTLPSWCKSTSKDSARYASLRPCKARQHRGRVPRTVQAAARQAAP